MQSRHLFKLRFFFNIRFLGLTSYKGNSKLYNFFFNRHINSFSLLPFEESKFQELFEMKDKSFYLASNLLSQDFSELSSVDSFKENYPLTQTYVKILEMIKNKPLYLHNNSVIIKEEIEKCFSQIEKFAKAYEASQLLASFLLDIQNFNSRLYSIPKKASFKNPFIKNFYDTKKKLHEEYEIILQNYKLIYEALNDYPLWQVKFDNEAKKMLSYSNILGDFPEVYSIVQQQKIFK